MAENHLVTEFELVHARIGNLIADVGSKEPALGADLLALSGKLSELKDRINDAYVIFNSYEGQETVPPIESDLESGLEAALGAVLGAIGGLPGGWRGIVSGAALGASADLLDWMGIDLFGLNKDVIYSQNSGADIIFGANVNANYTLGASDDRFFSRGLFQSSSVRGGSGDDIIVGGSADDRLNGDAGNDTIYTSVNGGLANGGDGDDKLIGDVGIDKIVGLDGRDLILAGAGNDTIAATQVDYLDIETNDGLIGGGGDDRIYGSAGSNTIYGDNTRDFTGDLQSNSELKALSAEARTHKYSDASIGGNDYISTGAGADYVSGGRGNDTILGGAGDDKLFGDNGNDTLTGATGSDDLYGGKGADKLDGGADKDTYHVTELEQGHPAKSYDNPIEKSWWNAADTLIDNWAEPNDVLLEYHDPSTGQIIASANLFNDYERLGDGSGDGALLIADGQWHYGANLYIKLFDGDGYLYRLNSTEDLFEYEINTIAVLKDIDLTLFPEYDYM